MIARSRARGLGGSLATLLIVGVVALSPLLGAPRPAGDGTPDGSCDACTLREAIQEANANQGADTINFNIPGAGPHTIQPATNLPDIVGPVIIDGYSEPGAIANENAAPAALSGNTTLLIVLDGSSLAAGGIGLTFRADADQSVVQGLVIRDFPFIGISLAGASGVKIVGNFIGTDASGTSAAAAMVSGITVEGSSNATIGGSRPAGRNIIASSGEGIRASSVNTIIQGNPIGTDRDASDDLGNGIGIRILGAAKKVTVGGTTAASANVIAFSDGNGVAVSDDQNTGNRILRNSIFANGDLGIDLGEDGITANDPKDPDTGPSRLQNFPTVTSVAIDHGTTTIKGTLNSTPETTFTVQLFVNKPGSGFDEGQILLGQKKVTTDKRGNARFAFTTDADIDSTDCVTATATNKKKRDTSEFSDCKLVND